jgi:hypothetical protein
MEPPCFKKKDSDPPACGLHNVPLVKKQLPAGTLAPGYESFAFLACPVSSQVINDEAPRSDDVHN